MSEKGTHDGHRDRMREKFILTGRQGFNEHEMLEMLLYYCIPRKNTNELGHKLIGRFGSLAGVFDADISDLMECGLTRNSAVYLHIVKEAGRCYYMGEGEKPRFVTIGDAAKYITGLLYGCRNEELHVFFMDMKLRLISQKRIAEGTIDKVVPDKRELLKAALSANAAYAILAHNHPSGSPRPSRSDVELTRYISRTFHEIGIKLCDHIIVSGGSYYSFNRGCGIEDGEEVEKLAAHQYADITD